MTTLFKIAANPTNQSGISSKIWRIRRTGRRLQADWGPAEFDRRSRKVVSCTWRQGHEWTFRSEEAARADEARRVKEKLREGYQPHPRKART